MKIAFLIVGHRDPSLIERVSKKLTASKNFEVFIHYDKKFDLGPLETALRDIPGIHICYNRHNVHWGGFSSVLAILKLLKSAYYKSGFERFVLFQGADYPLVSNEKIHDFFKENKTIEFIRASNISSSDQPIYYMKNRCYWFYDHPNTFKKIINNLNFLFPLKLRNAIIQENKEKYDVYFGTAQWAITEKCAGYILDFVDNHPKFMTYMKRVFSPDEIFFHTIVYNSFFRERTVLGKAELCKRSIEEIRNLHYFEYPASKIRVFEEQHLELLLNQNCLFFRKVDSKRSAALLNKIDEIHQLDSLAMSDSK